MTSGDFRAKAPWFALGVLASNLVQGMKLLFLDPEWKSKTVATLRGKPALKTGLKMNSRKTPGSWLPFRRAAGHWLPPSSKTAKSRAKKSLTAILGYFFSFDIA